MKQKLEKWSARQCVNKFLYCLVLVFSFTVPQALIQLCENYKMCKLWMNEIRVLWNFGVATVLATITEKKTEHLMWKMNGTTELSPVCN